MHAYRTHCCSDLRADHVGETVRLSGWIHSKRDHGNLLFIDLRDQAGASGMTQCVVDIDNPLFAELESLRVESVITVTGEVIQRSQDTVNAASPTGDIELGIQDLCIHGRAAVLPLQVAGDTDTGEDIRLRYRFLDLRREKMRRNIELRQVVIQSLRERMRAEGFTEYQTPILTASSPEGARDYLVASRRFPGQFYALPQAPQQFKQLFMIAGFDRYFQIAPCFRDEDARADRSPGEFYQLDLEMAFVTQDDVFAALEPVLQGVFEEFAEGKAVSSAPFRRIPYHDALLKYGSDKPDLRNPIEIADVSEVFRREDVSFKAFKSIVEKGGVVRAIPAPGAGERPRSWFDKLNDWARGEGAAGLGYIIRGEEGGKGPIAKFISEAAQTDIFEAAHVEIGDAVFFACDTPEAAADMAGKSRTRIGDDLNLINKDEFAFCWIVDFPMYEIDLETKAIGFSHNPFSMPQGGLEALNTMDPLDIKAWQYDIVCNGVELSSGAIRNHSPEIMLRAFEIAGYSEQEVEARFGGMLNALRYGAPPHGGSAPGIDRIVMLLAGEQNIREVTTFPLNQQGQDLMMGAPSAPSERHLRELHLKISDSKQKGIQDQKKHANS